MAETVTDGKATLAENEDAPQPETSTGGLEEAKSEPAKSDKEDAKEEIKEGNSERGREKRSDGTRQARSRSASPDLESRWAARERSPPRRQEIQSFEDDETLQGGQTAQRGFNAQKQICRDFLLGRCFRATCRFVHDESQAQRSRPAQQETCKDFMNGRCSRGRSCRFAHPAEAQNMLFGAGAYDGFG